LKELLAPTVLATNPIVVESKERKPKATTAAARIEKKSSKSAKSLLPTATANREKFYPNNEAAIQELSNPKRRGEIELKPRLIVKIDGKSSKPKRVKKITFCLPRPSLIPPERSRSRSYSHLESTFLLTSGGNSCGISSRTLVLLSSLYRSASTPSFVKLYNVKESN